MPPAPPENPGFTCFVPPLGTLSDDELSACFTRWDGAWSVQTRGLVAASQAAGLDLNDNWASTPPAWQCPCCLRWKPDLVRLSLSRILLCHLEWHHDHLRDRGKAILRMRNPRQEGPEGLAVSRAIDVCKGLTERFHTTLICKDCNAAEGQAKAALRGNVHGDFSFSPREIARFINAAPNRPHEVDMTAAAAIWAEARETFEDLVAFAQTLADRIAIGRHRKEGAPPRFAESPTPQAILYRLAVNEAGFGPLFQTATDLATRSVRRDGVGLGLRRARRAVHPTAADYAAFDSAQDQTTLWRKAPVDWICAACDRDRLRILRKSNAGAWTGKLHRFQEFLPETDPESLWQRGADDGETLVFGAHRQHLICGDCRHIITDAKVRAPEVSELAWRLSDLRALVAGASDNLRHEVDLDVALDLARQASAHQAAAEAYFEHRSEAMTIRSHVTLIRRRDACDVDQALFTLAWDDAYTEEENLAFEQRLRWLHNESDRLATPDPY
jgi:hypothetical protein